jgi:hypothetical protein
MAPIRKAAGVVRDMDVLVADAWISFPRARERGGELRALGRPAICIAPREFPVGGLPGCRQINSAAWANYILKMIDFFNFLDMLIILL